MIFNYNSAMETTPLANHWLDLLQSAGCRVTAPRRAIVELMASSSHALGPIEIYDRGRAEYPRLGLVTVYRTLEKLEALGLIERVHLPDGCHRYLRATEGHSHLLMCTGCGLVLPFAGDDLGRLTGRVANDTGFQINEHWLQLFGICPDCQKATAAAAKV
jgi:Fe2+ or Zn2+ uptake regulation protein